MCSFLRSLLASIARCRLLESPAAHLALLVGLALVAPAHAEEDLGAELRFEVTHSGEIPSGWGGGPQETIHLDGEIVHAGDWAVRLERDESSASSFSTLTRAIPVGFEGDSIQLSGYLRSEEVGEFFGLWMREDGTSGALQFDNMQKRELKGTTEWTRYEINLPLHPKAKQIFFGALVAGTGKIWIDDLELRVDGVLVQDAPAVEKPPTAIDLDHEFDEGSGIDIGRPSETQIANLTTLGRVWGFLKYHHPRVTAGELHWDYELFRILPQVLHAWDENAGRAILLEWVQDVGVPAECDPCAEEPRGDVHLRPDLSWLDETETLGAELSELLRLIHRSRPATGKQFYVSLFPGVGNPAFDNELAYQNLTRPDAGYRLLALFRFWNIIEYWFPYRDLIEEDWAAVLAEFVPRLAPEVDYDAYQRQLLALVARVHDGHANLWSSLVLRPPTGECRLPVDLRYVEGHPTVVGYLAAPEGPTKGLEIGDAILALDGQAVETLLEDWSPYYAVSNEASLRKDVARAMTRGECGPCQVRVSRGGQEVELEISRLPQSELTSKSAATHDLPGDTFRLLSDEVAYLKLSSAESAKAAEYVRQAEGTRGLVIDIRNYPKEFMVFALGPRLVREMTPFARFTKGDLSNPGVFSWTSPVSLGSAQPHYDGKVVILVDELSMSQSEYTAMCFRAAPGSIVVGSQTAGADGNVSPFALPPGLRTMISGIGVFYPDKTPTQRVGIVPDIEVHPTRRGVIEGRDEVLEEALRQILGPEIPAEEIERLARG